MSAFNEEALRSHTSSLHRMCRYYGKAAAQQLIQLPNSKADVKIYSCQASLGSAVCCKQNPFNKGICCVPFHIASCRRSLFIMSEVFVFVSRDSRSALHEAQTLCQLSSHLLNKSTMFRQVAERAF